MRTKSATTYTLSDDDLKTAVAEFITRRREPVEAAQVKIEITPGTPYYNQLDAGSPPSLKVTVEVEGA